MLAHPLDATKTEPVAMRWLELKGVAKGLCLGSPECWEASTLLGDEPPRSLPDRGRGQAPGPEVPTEQKHWLSLHNTAGHDRGKHPTQAPRKGPHTDSDGLREIPGLVLAGQSLDVWSQAGYFISLAKPQSPHLTPPGLY